MPRDQGKMEGIIKEMLRDVMQCFGKLQDTLGEIKFSLKSVVQCQEDMEGDWKHFEK